MALNRTWYTRAEVAISDFTTALRTNQSILWALKALLMQQIAGGTVGTGGAPVAGAAWTCAGSSDGTTAGMDAVDRWTAAFDNTKLVPAFAGSAHSWIVLQAPAALGAYQLCIDYNNTSGFNWTVVLTKTTLFTGGSTTARPTSATEYIVSNGSAFTENVAADHKVGYATAANGAFVFLPNKVGAGLFNMCLYVVDLDSARSADAMKVWGGFSFGASVKGAPLGSTAPVGRISDNSAGSNTLTNYNSMFATSAPLNGIDTKADVYEIIVMSYNAPLGGIRGKLPDFRWTPSGCLPGRSVPSVAAIEQVSAGEMLVPWSVPPTL